MLLFYNTLKNYSRGIFIFFNNIKLYVQIVICVIVTPFLGRGEKRSLHDTFYSHRPQNGHLQITIPLLLDEFSNSVFTLSTSVTVAFAAGL